MTKNKKGRLPGMRTCRRCHEKKPSTSFTLNRGHYCDDCHNSGRVMMRGRFMRISRPDEATGPKPSGFAPVPAQTTIWEIEEEILLRKQLETPYGVWQPEMERR